MSQHSPDIEKGTIPDRLRDMYVARRRYKQQKGQCFYCGKPLDMSTNIDHVWPTSRGGPRHWGNKVLAHAKCNLRKGNRLPTEGELKKLMRICKVRWPLTFKQPAE